MIILKSFSSTTDMVAFKDSIICRTNPWINRGHHDGLYSKTTNNTIIILNVENNYSLRGSNINIGFYGTIITFFKKKILLGYIGPSIIFTIFSLLILIYPWEYLHVRIIALLLWIIVYWKDINKIHYLKEFIQK